MTPPDALGARKLLRGSGVEAPGRRLNRYPRIPLLARPRLSWTTASSTDAVSRFP